MSLKIYVLGQFRLQANEQPIESPSRPAQSLLAYLARRNRALSRRQYGPDQQKPGHRPDPLRKEWLKDAPECVIFVRQGEHFDTSLGGEMS